MELKLPKSNIDEILTAINVKSIYLVSGFIAEQRQKEGRDAGDNEPIKKYWCELSWGCPGQYDFDSPEFDKEIDYARCGTGDTADEAISMCVEGFLYDLKHGNGEACQIAADLISQKWKG